MPKVRVIANTDNTVKTVFQAAAADPALPSWDVAASNSNDGKPIAVSNVWDPALKSVFFNGSPGDLSNSIRNYLMTKADTTDAVELITNGTFPTDLSGWTVTNLAGSTTVWTSAGHVTMTGDGVNQTSLDQSFTTVIGRSYTVRVDINLALTGVTRIDIGTSQGGSTIVSGNALQSAIGNASFIAFVATATTTWIRLRKNTSGATVFNAISVQRGALPIQISSVSGPWIYSSVDSTMTLQVVGLGTEAGMNYVDVRIHGTPQVDHCIVRFESVSGVLAQNTQTWIASGFFKLVSGALTNVTSTELGIYSTNGGSVVLPELRTAFPLTNALTRATSVHTLANAATTNVFSGIAVYMTIGQPVDLTVRIALPTLGRVS